MPKPTAKNNKTCPYCRSKDVRAKGRAMGNVGKRAFQCGSCLRWWQYGY